MIGRREIFSQPKTLALNYGMLTAYLKEKKTTVCFSSRNGGAIESYYAPPADVFTPSRIGRVRFSLVRDETGYFSTNFVLNPSSSFRPVFPQ